MALFNLDQSKEWLSILDQYDNGSTDEGYENARETLEEMEAHIARLQSIVDQRSSKNEPHQIYIANQVKIYNLLFCNGNYFRPQEKESCEMYLTEMARQVSSYRDRIEERHQSRMHLSTHPRFANYGELDDYYYKLHVQHIHSKYELLHERFYKTGRERMYFIGYTPNPSIEAKKRHIEGSIQILGQLKSDGLSREEYEVKLFRANQEEKGSFSCSCADFKFKCMKNQIVCKHIIYLVSKVAGIYDTSFYETRTLSEAHRQKFMEKIQVTPAICEREKEILKGGNAVPFNKAWKELDATEMCPICFDEMGTEMPWLSCPMCTNYMHKECMEVWLNKSKTCVLCRNSCWMNYR